MAGLGVLPVSGFGESTAVESRSTLEVHPTGLSKGSPMPVSPVFSEQIERSDGMHVSPLQQLTIDLDRHLAIDVRGLPRCGAWPIDNPREREEDPCAPAKVGSGQIEVEVAFPEQAPIRLSA
ncbi:MAG TPA: hypothetical protein VFS26_07760, partial [Solirubrobacterales bacterium]|nr:hypothetical protein [Solirubrobacterales bacterium]